MPRHRRTIFWLTAIGVVLFGLLYFLPSLLGFLAEAELRRRGVLQPRVEIAELGFQATTISRLTLEFPAGNRRYRLATREILLTYRLPELLSGRIKAIRFSEAELQVGLAAAREQPPLPHETEIPQPSRWLGALPFQALSLGHLHLELATEEGNPLLLDVGGALTRDERSLRAKLAIAQAGHAPLQAEAVLSPGEQSSFSIIEAAGFEEFLSLTAGPIERAGRRLKTDLHLKADLGQLQQVISDWRPSAVPEGLSGSLSAQLHLSLPASISTDILPAIAAAWLEGQGRLTFALPQVKGLAGAPKADFSFGLTLENQVLYWRLEKTSRASFYPLLSARSDKKSAAGDWLLRQGRQPVVMTVPAGAAGQIPLDGSLFAKQPLQLPGAFQLDYGSAASPLQLRLRQVSLALRLQPSLRVHSDFSFSGILLESGLVPAGKISSSGRAQMTMENDKLSLAVQPGAEVSIADLHFESVTIPAARLEATTPVSCAFGLKKAKWRCQQFGFGLTVPEAEVADLTVRTGPGTVQIGNLAGNPQNWRLKLRAMLPDWGLQRGGNLLKLDRVLADLQADREKLSSHLTVQAAGGGVELTADATHLLTARRGEAHFQLNPVDFADHKDVPERLFGNSLGPLRIDTGRIAAEGEISWRPAGPGKAPSVLNQSSRLRLQDLDGTYKNIRFQNLDSEFTLQGLEPLRVDPPANLHLAALDAGFPLTDIGLTFGITLPTETPPKFIISDLHARTLGGELTSDKIELDLAREKNLFTVRLRALSLEEVLKLEQKEGLQGTGIIDGELPVVLTPTGLSVAEGQLAARAPGGILRYTANERVKAFAESNPNLQLLLHALEEFHYASLEANVVYAENGILNLQLKLRGNNPDLEGGRPVHLNLGIEENILTLLHSLRLAEDISGKIGEKVQQRGSGH